MPKNRYLLFPVFIVLLFFRQASFVFALESKYPDILGHSIENNSSLSEYVLYFFVLGISLAGILALISFVIGAVSLIISGDNAERASSAKDRMKGSLSGLALILVSFIIIQTINPSLKNLNLTPLPKAKLPNVDLPQPNFYKACPGDNPTFSRFIIDESSDSSKSGITFYSEPHGWDVGAKAGYSNNFSSSFNYNNVDRPPEYKNMCKTFKECPGSIKTNGYYLIVLSSGDDCQTFFKNVPNLRVHKFAASGKIIDKVSVIPVK